MSTIRFGGRHVGIGAGKLVGGLVGGLVLAEVGDGVGGLVPPGGALPLEFGAGVGGFVGGLDGDILGLAGARRT